MGSNHSKLCSGVPEREFRRALQDRVQQMYVTPPGAAEAAVHIHCREDEVERYLDEIYADPVMFHFKVEKAPEVKPESSVEGGEKPGAAAAAVSLEAKAAEPGGNVTGKSKRSGDAEVRSQPSGGMVVKMDAQASDLELTLAGLCNQVLHTLHVGDFSERTKGHSPVEDISPSSLETEHEKTSRVSSERPKGHSPVEDISPSSLETEHKKTSRVSSERTKGHSPVENISPSSLETEHEKTSRVPSERPKGHSPVEDLSPSSLESVPSILSSGSQTRSPSIGAVGSLNSGDVHHPNKDTSFTDDLKAPCGLELATGDMSGVAEEPTTGQMQLEEASSEETLGEADEGSSEDTIEETSDASSGGTLEEVREAPPDLGPDEMADGCSDVKADLETKQLAEILLSLNRGLPRATSEPLSIQKEKEGEVPEDYSDGGKADAQLEVLPKRAQHEMSAMVDSGDKKEQVIASKVFLMESHGRSIQTLHKKTAARRQDSLLLASGAVDLDSFQKDRAIPTPGTTKEKEHQTSAVQNTEVQPSANIAEMTGAASPPKALSETAETGQGGPLFASAESVPHVSRTEDNRPGAQLSPASVGVSDAALDDGSPGQRC